MAKSTFVAPGEQGAPALGQRQSVLGPAPLRGCHREASSQYHCHSVAKSFRLGGKQGEVELDGDWTQEGGGQKWQQNLTPKLESPGARQRQSIVGTEFIGAANAPLPEDISICFLASFGSSNSQEAYDWTIKSQSPPFLYFRQCVMSS